MLTWGLFFFFGALNSRPLCSFPSSHLRNVSCQPTTKMRCHCLELFTMFTIRYPPTSTRDLSESRTTTMDPLGYELTVDKPQWGKVTIDVVVCPGIFFFFFFFSSFPNYNTFLYLFKLQTYYYKPTTTTTMRYYHYEP